MRLLQSLVFCSALLVGCGAAPSPTTSVHAGPAASAGPVTREVLERLWAGHRAEQGRWVVASDNTDVALLKSYDGKSLTIAGTMKAEKQSTMLGAFTWVALSADTETAGRVPFATREFGSDAEADAFIAAIPTGKPTTVTFNVVRFPGRWVGASSPFVFVAAK
jgi:hypothetical protein